MGIFYYLRLDGVEEKWISWSRWSSVDSEDDGLYITRNKIRGSMFSEETLEDEKFRKCLGKWGSYTLVPASEQEVKKYRSRIYLD